MTAVDEAKSESRPFEADVAKLLHMIVHSVYSDRDVFLRELIRMLPTPAKSFGTRPLRIQSWSKVTRHFASR